MTKTDRQREILTILSTRRYAKIVQLAEELGVSHDTIKRDLDELTSSASFTIESGRYGGGVYASDGWYYSKTYLTNDQEAKLRSMLSRLQPEDQKTIQDVLTAFAKPKPKEVNH